MLNSTIRRTAVTVAALGALGLGGSAIAGAAGDSSSSSGSGSAQTRPDRQSLSGDVAAKVKQAALDKLPGATVLRTEAGGPYGSAYHAHVRTSDGTLKVVLVDGQFNVTNVVADQGRGPGRGGPGGHKPEAALTGATKKSVEAAVLARYPGATILRTETNTDGSAPYESHIKTSDGKELEVQVSKDFAVVASNERPAHP